MPSSFVYVMTAVSLLEIALAIPLVLRRIRPNALYGLRTSDTLADEWVWYEANAASGRDLAMLAALQLVAIYLPLAFAPDFIGYYVVANLGLAFFGTLAVAFLGVARAHYLLKSRRAGRE